MYEPSTHDLGIATLTEAREHCEAASQDRKLKLVEHFALELNRGDFYRLLGEQWSAFSHLRWHAQFLRDQLRRATEEDLLAMMTTHEAQLRDALPKHFIIYRGCFHQNVEGLSWCIDRRVAAQYPYTPELWIEEPPLLATAEVRRLQTVVKLRPTGLEVIAWKAKVVSVEMLPPRSLSLTFCVPYSNRAFAP